MSIAKVVRIFFNKEYSLDVKKSQLDANLFLVYFVKIYMFRKYLGPSSGGTTVCIQQFVFIILFR